MLLVLLSLALAEPEGHYHPDTIAAASATFARAQEHAMPRYQDRSSRSKALAAAFDAWEEAMNLLGGRVPDAEHALRTDAYTRYQRQLRAVSAHAQSQLDGFDSAFQAAVKRALDGRDAEVCKTRSGPRLGRFQGGEAACPGDDLNDDIVRAIDADDTLTEQIDALLAQPWPDFDLKLDPASPLPPAPRSLNPRDLLTKAGLSARLDAIRSTDDDARLELRAALEGDPSAEELSALRAKGHEITVRTAVDRAMLAEPVIEAAEGAAAKAQRRGASPLGWCVRPDLLGGCEGTTAEPSAFAEHPAVRRAAKKITRR